MGRPAIYHTCDTCLLPRKTHEFGGHKSTCTTCRHSKQAAVEPAATNAVDITKAVITNDSVLFDRQIQLIQHAYKVLEMEDGSRIARWIAALQTQIEPLRAEQARLSTQVEIANRQLDTQTAHLEATLASLNEQIKDRRSTLVALDREVDARREDVKRTTIEADKAQIHLTSLINRAEKEVALEEKREARAAARALRAAEREETLQVKAEERAMRREEREREEIELAIKREADREARHLAALELAAKKEAAREARRAAKQAERAQKPESLRTSLRALSGPQFRAEVARTADSPFTPAFDPGKLDFPKFVPPPPPLGVGPAAISMGEGETRPSIANVPSLPVGPPPREPWRIPVPGSMAALKLTEKIIAERVAPWALSEAEMQEFVDSLPPFYKAREEYFEEGSQELPFDAFTLPAFAAAYWCARAMMTGGVEPLPHLAGPLILKRGLELYPEIEPPTPFADIYEDQAVVMAPIVARIRALPPRGDETAAAMQPATSREIDMLTRSFEN